MPNVLGWFDHDRKVAAVAAAKNPLGLAATLPTPQPIPGATMTPALPLAVAATLAAVPQPIAVAVPAKKASVLSHIGSVLRSVLHIGEAVASVAEPFVAVRFPNIVPIYNSAVSLAMNAETELGAAPGTGAQKLAFVATALVPQAQQWAAANGIAWDNDGITKWASAVADSLNMIPQPTVPPATT